MMTFSPLPHNFEQALAEVKADREAIKSLRAKVASLKEERDGLAESVQGMYDTLHKYWPGTINELLEDWQRLTQQLAAANAKIDALMREYCPDESQKPTPAQAYYMMPCAQLLAQAQDAGTGNIDGDIIEDARNAK